MKKASVDELRQGFDADVERFSNLERGHEAAMDSPLALELIASAAAATTPHARTMLDVGCGGGNYALKLLQRLPQLEITLLDLSEAMLARARERVTAADGRVAATVQSDIRRFAPAGRYDVIVASAVLHHLREEEEWRRVFRLLHDALEPGGSLWIYDILEHEIPPVAALMQHRYGDYLTGIGGDDYRDTIFARIERDDTPRSLPFQLEILRESGFSRIDVLHKNARFAAFGAVREA